MVPIIGSNGFWDTETIDDVNPDKVKDPHSHEVPYYNCLCPFGEIIRPGQNIFVFSGRGLLKWPNYTDPQDANGHEWAVICKASGGTLMNFS